MFLNQPRSVEAKLVGTTVVAAFHNSNPNLIWKYDLERNHSFTLALQGEEGDFELGVTSPKGEFSSIARFSSREDADQAFAAVQNVLMKRKWSRMRTVLTSVAGLLVMIYVFSWFINPISANRDTGTKTEVSASTRTSSRSGVPVSADQILQPPP